MKIMDFREIFDRAYANAYELLPFSDSNTVIRSVKERAEKTMNSKTKIYHIDEVDTAYEQRKAAQKKSRAPLICGIAAGAAAALGVGFFAGSLTHGGIEISSPANGAGYSVITDITDETPNDTAAEEKEPEFETPSTVLSMNSILPKPTVSYCSDDALDTGISPSDTYPISYDFGDVTVWVNGFEFDGMLIKGDYDIVWKNEVPENVYKYIWDEKKNSSQYMIEHPKFAPLVWLAETETHAYSVLEPRNGSAYFYSPDTKTLRCKTWVCCTHLCDSVDLRFIYESEEYRPTEERQTKSITVVKDPSIAGTRFITDTDIPLISGRTGKLYEISLCPSTLSFRYENINDTSYFNGFDIAVVTDEKEYLIGSFLGGNITDEYYEIIYNISDITEQKGIGSITAIKFIDRTDMSRTKTVELYSNEAPAVTMTAQTEEIPEELSE